MARTLAILVILMLPLVHFVVNPVLPFGGVRTMDSWYYVGHFVTYPQSQQQRPHYDGERIAWILPGMVLHRVFEPDVARVIHWTLYCQLAMLGLYWTVSPIAGRRAGLTAAVLLGCYPYFHSSMSWPYVDGAVMTYAALGMAAVTRAIHARPGRRHWWLIAAGVAVAAVALSNLFAVFLGGGLWLYAVLAQRHQTDRHCGSFRTMFRSTCWMGVGFLGTVGAAVVLTQVTFGHPNILKFSLEMIAGAARSQPADAPYESMLFFSWAGWLVVPGAVVTGAIIYLVGLALRDPARGPADRRAIGLVANLLFVSLVLVYFTVAPIRILTLEYYASYVIPSLFAVVGTVLLVPPFSPRYWLMLTLAGAAAIESVPMWSPELAEMVRPTLTLGWAWRIAAACCAASALINARGATRSDRRWLPEACGWSAGVGVIAFVSVAFMPIFGADGFIRRNTFQFRENAQRRVYVATVDGLTMVRRWCPFPAELTFWYDQGEDRQFAYLSLICAARSHMSAMRDFPAIASDRKLRPGHNVILLSERPEIIDAARAALRRQGLSARVIEQARVRGKVGYWITVLQLAADDGSEGDLSAATVGQVAPKP